MRYRLVYRTRLLPSFIVGSCLDDGIFLLLLLVLGSSRLAVVAILVVLVDQLLKGLLTIPARTSPVFVRPAVASNCPVERSLSSRGRRFFGCQGFPFDEACNVSARDAEHCRQSIMPIAKIAWLAAIGLRQTFDSINGVTAVSCGKPCPP